MRRRRDRSGRPWHLYVLGLAAIAVAALAIAEIGPPSSSARTSTEVVTAAQGVVQSTVTGSGNMEPSTDVDVNFNTSGTLADVYVSQGQHVQQGQLLAELDPTVAQLQLNEAEESLTAAQDNLTAVEDGTSTGGSSGNGSNGSNVSYTVEQPTTEFVSDTTTEPEATTTTTETSTTTETVTAPETTKPGGSSQPKSTKPKSTEPTTTEPKSTKPKTTEPKSGTGGQSSHPSGSGSGSHPSGSGSGSHPSGSGSQSESGSQSGSGGNSGGSSSHETTTTTSTTPSPGSIASAQASVYSAQVSVENAETALANTKLYAPVSGTIVSLSSATPGQSVSGGSSSSGSSGSGSGSSGSSGSSGGGAAAGGSSSAGGLGSSSSSSGSSSAFAEIVDPNALTMTVAFSESDITKVAVGQPATITLNALTGVELAAKVTSISTVGSSSSGVVSYDAVLTPTQSDSRIRPGMSASASVIVGQADGVTVPNQAVTGTGSLGTVNVMKNGKSVPTQVVVGLRGDSRTEIVSGLSAGEQVVITITLPSLNSSTTGAGSSSSGTLGGSRFGGAGGFGGLGGGGGFSRGAGGGG